ncbi:unnamed protein product [Closterium sp. NIES-65]|nr:unnamed protein product [Closterium sp. NIES-65]
MLVSSVFRSDVSISPAQATWFGVAAAVAVVGATTLVLSSIGKPEVKGKSTTELSGGKLKKDEVANGWTNYDRYFQQNPGEGVTEKSQAPQFVDTFYNLVTDIYEWGWGQSFHFSPALPGKSDREATIAHEEYIATILKLKPGMKVLDAGCGVGGPMRAIAAKSGANVTGVTINEYQVERAQQHNARRGLDKLCTVVQGNFLELPFEDNSFDAAYSIEATCHAPKLTDVYGEIFRVLKPGQLYATYEWVKTHKYDPDNKEHVKIIDDICYGNALPELRSYKEIVEAAEAVGFEVIDNRDVAAPPALPWWTRLKIGRIAPGSSLPHTCCCFGNPLRRPPLKLEFSLHYFSIQCCCPHTLSNTPFLASRSPFPHLVRPSSSSFVYNTSPFLPPLVTRHFTSLFASACCFFLSCLPHSLPLRHSILPSLHPSCLPPGRPPSLLLSFSPSLRLSVLLSLSQFAPPSLPTPIPLASISLSLRPNTWPCTFISIRYLFPVLPLYILILFCPPSHHPHLSLLSFEPHLSGHPTLTPLLTTCLPTHSSQALPPKHLYTACMCA